MIMENEDTQLPAWVEPGTRGFVFATTGEMYTILARRAARNLRQCMPECSIDLFTDQTVEDPVFDKVHALGHSWFRPKMQTLRESRFEYSIVLDADIIVVADISEVFEVLDRCDIAGAEASVSRQREMIPPDQGVPRCFQPVNSGFLAVRASQKLCDFSESWEKAVRESGSRFDQPALRTLLYEGHLRFMPLGSEYNLIDIDRLDIWGKIRGAPRVLHVRDLHQRPSGDPNMPFSLSEAIGEQRATHVDRLIKADWSLGGDENLTAKPPRAAPQATLSLRKAVRKLQKALLSKPRRHAKQKNQHNAKYGPYQSAVLAHAACNNKKTRICVICANDGKLGDPIHRLATADLAARTEMLLFEPQHHLIPYLNRHYASHPDYQVINAAVGPSSELVLHAVKPDVWPLMNPHYAAGWAEYRAPTGITSSDRSSVLWWVKKHGPKDCDAESMVEEIKVQCSPLPATLRELKLSIDVDVLQIDVEGMDDEVLYACDIEQTKPSIIFLEIENLPLPRLQKLKKYLEHGYFMTVLNRDLLAIKRPE